MQLHELVADALPIAGASTTEITDIVHDSRAARPGALFACIPGQRTDGHDHADAALERGAAALLVERLLPLDVPQVIAPSVRSLLGPMAARLFNYPSNDVAIYGVTGTNGKTTTTYLLEAMLRAASQRPAVIGTTGVRYDGEIVPAAHTTPEADDLQRLFADVRERGAKTVAMEVSSHALAMERTAGTTFVAVGFTNLSHDHLDFHGTMEHYFEAKALLFRQGYARNAAIAVDTDYGALMAKRAYDEGLDVLSVGGSGDLVLEDVMFNATGTTGTLADRRSGDRSYVSFPAVGAFNVQNALVAAGMFIVAGGTLETAAAGLADADAVPGRMQRVDIDAPFSVIVDYAHTPDALMRVLEAARPLACEHRLLLVFGCGGDRDPHKRAPMGGIAARLADVIIVTSDNPRSERPEDIADEVVRGVEANNGVAECVLDRRDAIVLALSSAQPGDVVVIAGKGHETGQTANGITTPFDDRDVVRELWSAR